MTWQPYDTRGRPNVPKSDPYDLGQLDKLLRDRLYTLFHDAPTQGLTLVSGYRDPGRQWDLRHDRVPGHEWDNRYKGHPVTAVPARWNPASGLWEGGSHHGLRGNGIGAADIGGRDLQWAIDNRARYGLGLTVLSENWHNEATGIDKRTRRKIGAPTVRILEYPGPSWDDPEPEPEDIMTPAQEAKLDGLVASVATLGRAVVAQAAEIADLHEQWIGKQVDAKDETLRQLLKTTEARTAEIVIDTRALTKG